MFWQIPTFQGLKKYKTKTFGSFPGIPFELRCVHTTAVVCQYHLHTVLFELQTWIYYQVKKLQFVLQLIIYYR